jgi:hypothetical protein
MRLPPDEVPEESKFLLEIDFTKLRHKSTEKQSYWVHAVWAAVTAGRRRVFAARRRQPLISQSTSVRRPHINFGRTDIRPSATYQSTTPAAHGTKRYGSTTDPSNKR